METVLDNVTDGVLVVDDDWRITRTNAVVADLLGRDESALVGRDATAVFPRSASETFHEHVGEGRDPGVLSFEEYFPDLDAWLAVRTVPADGGHAIYLRDVTGRKTVERQRDNREAELERLDRINGIIQAIIRELVGATTREEIEQIICDRLASGDRYEYVWIGERDASTGRLLCNLAAGEYEDVVDLGIGSGDATNESPEQLAAETGETQVVGQLVEADDVPDRIKREAFAHGLQSSTAVPIRYGNSTYGVLSVYATHPDAFSERERESLETLGVTAGFVITAARQRNLLLSDTVVELVFSVADRDVAFVAAAAELDCSLTVEGTVPIDDGSLVCFVAVDGASPQAVLDLLGETTSGAAGRIVHEATTDDVGGVVEVTLSGESPLLTLVERGATVRTAEFDGDSGGRIVAGIAPDADVRALVESVGSAAPRTELLSKRERRRSVETAQEFRSGVHDRLTERQRTALRTAFHGGYYESPRDSTAEELAETLGISSPTFHDHLRAGEWKLLDAFFESESTPERLRPRGSDTSTDDG
jgi:GAF domain-containing protein